jgi:hypothetical protein
MTASPKTPSKLKIWSARPNDLLSLLLLFTAILGLGGFAVYADWKAPSRPLAAIIAVLFTLLALYGLARAWQRTKTHDARRGPAHRVFIWLGALSLLAIIVVNEFGAHDKRGSLWPLLLASAGCVYLWWLASLIFDLVFVWHRYIQGDVAINFLRKDFRAKGTDRGPDPAASGAPRPPTAPSSTPSIFRLRLRKDNKPQLATE